MESRRFEEMGRGWADTAHATELQRADMKGEGMRIYDGNIGTEIWVRTRAADRIFLSFILLSKLPLHPSLVPSAPSAAEAPPRIGNGQGRV